MASSFRRKTVAGCGNCEDPVLLSLSSDSESSLPQAFGVSPPLSSPLHPSTPHSISKSTTNSSSLSTPSSSSSSSSSSTAYGWNGTKPWTSGVTLTSFGLHELDVILGGGHPLGTAIMVITDPAAHLAQCLLQYWCAEALSQKQHLLIPVLDFINQETCQAITECPSPLVEDDPEEFGNNNINHHHQKQQQQHYNHDYWKLASSSQKSQILELLRSLPRNRHWSSSRRRRSSTRSAFSSSSSQPPSSETLLPVGSSEENDLVGLPTLPEENDASENEEEISRAAAAAVEAKAEAGLKIAWQYRKSVQQERYGVSSSSSSSSSSKKYNFCHHYDLSGQWTDNRLEGDAAVPVEQAAHIVSLHAYCGNLRTPNLCPIVRGYILFMDLLEILKSLLNSASTPSQVIRLVLSFQDDTTIGALSVALPLFLSHIRTYLLPVVTLVTLPSRYVHPLDSDCSDSSSVVTATPNTSYGAVGNELQRCCDAVLIVESFLYRTEYPPPVEFRHLHGLLHVRKINLSTGATAIGAGHWADWTTYKRPSAFLYGLQRNRRSLKIPMLHIPPEDNHPGDKGGWSGENVQRPYSAGMCGTTGGGSGNTPLDF